MNLYSKRRIVVSVLGATAVRLWLCVLVYFLLLRLCIELDFHAQGEEIFVAQQTVRLLDRI